MTANQKAEILKTISALLDEPNVDVNMDTGTHGTPNYQTGFMEFAPTNGRTITIKIHGGAVDTRDPVGMRS